MVQDVKPGGSFLLNCQWSDEELDKHLPAKRKKYSAENNSNFYTIDGVNRGKEIGLEMCIRDRGLTESLRP